MFTFHFDWCQDICSAREMWEGQRALHDPSLLSGDPISILGNTWHHLGRHDEGDPGDDDEEARSEVDLQQYSTVQYSTVQYSTVLYCTVQ